MQERVIVPEEELANLISLRDADRLCLAISGRCPKVVASEIGMEYKHFARIMGPNDEDRRYLPDDKRVPFMRACGNLIPLHWLALQVGRQVQVPPSENISAELEKERALRMHQEKMFVDIIKRIRTAPTRLREKPLRQTKMSVVPIPAWMKREIAEIERRAA